MGSKRRRTALAVAALVAPVLALGAGFAGMSPAVAASEPPRWPAEIHEAQAVAEDTISVSAWEGDNEPIDAVTGIRIYRADVEEGPFQLIADLPGALVHIDDAGLAHDTTYWYKAAAYNDHGQGPLSAARAATTGLYTPGPPTALAARPLSTHQIELSWQPPLDDGGSPVVHYEVWHKPVGGSWSDFTTTQLAVRLWVDKSTEYELSVYAVNGVGRGPASTVMYDPQGRPPAPEALHASTPPEAGAIELHWSAATEADIQADGYRIRRRHWSGAPWTIVADVPAGQTSYLDRGLVSGVRYEYQVSGFNAAGEGVPASTAGTTHSPPMAPSDLHAETGDGDVMLSWSAARSTLPVTGYVVYRSDGSEPAERIADLAADARTLIDSGVVVGTWYRYEVAALSDAGEGSRAMVSVQALALPEAPRDVIATIDPDPADVHADRLVRVSWSPPVFTGGTEITEYVIYQRGLDGEAVQVARVSGDLRSHRLPLLAPGGSFEYAVSAVNPAGEGPASDWVSPLSG